MRTKLLAFTLMSLWSLNAFSADMTTETKTEEIAFQLLNVVDLQQTLYVAHNPDKFYESESAYLIGEHPSDAKVYALMAGSALIHFVVTQQLAQHNAPMWVQRAWQIITISDKVHATVNNYQIGVKLNF